MFGVDLQQVLLLQQPGCTLAGGPVPNQVGGEVRGPALSRSGSMPADDGVVSSAMTGRLGAVPLSPLPLGGSRSAVHPSPIVAMAQAVSAAKAALELAGERQQSQQ